MTNETHILGKITGFLPNAKECEIVENFTRNNYHLKFKKSMPSMNLGQCFLIDLRDVEVLNIIKPTKYFIPEPSEKDKELKALRDTLMGKELFSETFGESLQTFKSAPSKIETLTTEFLHNMLKDCTPIGDVPDNENLVIEKINDVSEGVMNLNVTYKGNNPIFRSILSKALQESNNEKE